MSNSVPNSHRYPDVGPPEQASGSFVSLERAHELGKVVYDTMLLYFGTTDSLKTWPTCAEHHLSLFIFALQVPEDKVNETLALIRRFSKAYKTYYCEFDDMESLFYASVDYIWLQDVLRDNKPLLTRYAKFMRARSYTTVMYNTARKKIWDLLIKMHRDERKDAKKKAKASRPPKAMGPVFNATRNRRNPSIIVIEQETERYHQLVGQLALIRNIVKAAVRAKDGDNERSRISGPFDFGSSSAMCQPQLCCLDVGALFYGPRDDPNDGYNKRTVVFPDAQKQQMANKRAQVYTWVSDIELLDGSKPQLRTVHEPDPGAAPDGTPVDASIDISILSSGFGREPTGIPVRTGQVTRFLARTRAAVSRKGPSSVGPLPTAQITGGAPTLDPMEKDPKKIPPKMSIAEPMKMFRGISNKSNRRKRGEGTSQETRPPTPQAILRKLLSPRERS